MPTLKDLVEKGDVNLKATYLSQEEKNALAENGQPFDVLNIGYSEKGRFGPMWTATVSLAGEEVEMSFGGASGRDGYMRDMQDVIREHGAIEGVRLVVVGERQGNKILAFAPAEEAADDLPF